MASKECNKIYLSPLGNIPCLNFYQQVMIIFFVLYVQILNPPHTFRREKDSKKHIRKDEYLGMLTCKGQMMFFEFQLDSNLGLNSFHIC